MNPDKIITLSDFVADLIWFATRAAVMFLLGGVLVYALVSTFVSNLPQLCTALNNHDEKILQLQGVRP